MKVRLFMTLPAEHRTSSQIYGRMLKQYVEQLDDGISIDLIQPSFGVAGRLKEPHLRRAAQWFDRYAIYQTQCLTKRGSLAHIVDHGYSHLAFSLGPPRCVITFHDAVLLKLAAGEINGMPERPRATIAAHRFGLRALRRCARVITPSQNTKEDLLRFVGVDSDRVSVIPLAAHPAFAPAINRQRSDTLRVLSIGHTGAVKNVETTLCVIAKLRQTIDVQLIRVGEPFTEHQEGLIDRLKIRQAIDDRGRLPFEQIPEIYRQSDVLLLPSRYEGFGLPVLEAMASGLPVVASRAGSIPEVAGGAASLHQPDDIDGMATAIAEIHATPQKADSMRQAGLKRAAEFSWEKTAKLTADAYRRTTQ